jgi:hypothetical protein
MSSDLAGRGVSFPMKSLLPPIVRAYDLHECPEAGGFIGARQVPTSLNSTAPTEIQENTYDRANLSQR